ncbi:MAG TPA: hypothetical protein PL048_04680 [Leptospiraceae bacterium]|nr:hypothetical protein [Leptospiraceae bacterium]HMZ58044.1 hypothetical protein [Leptospiraceae bacterium]HNF15823.1 hypothetical protein [Leptospiraceae bacterium]HNF25270.1 hypothetical protein [Leptospiraceae bacterium]HNI96861.1 hypothetical protein [Leptospiraceae bacterium]
MNQILCCFYLILFSGCFLWKSDSLKPEKIAQLKIGSTTDTIQADLSNNSLMNFPIHIPVGPDRIYISDFRNSVLKVFFRNGRLDFLIGRKKIDETSRFVTAPVQNIGLAELGSDEDLYLQSRITEQKESPEEKRDYFHQESGYFTFRSPMSVPSYIFHFSRENKLMEILGKGGINSPPFSFIDSMHSGSGRKLFVVHRESEELILGMFEKGNLTGQLKESEMSSGFEEEKTKYRIALEKILPEYYGEYALAAFTFSDISDQRFKFRRIYKYYYNKTKKKELLKEGQDPAEILFSIREDGSFYIWETEKNGNSVRLQLHDRNGIHIQNRKLKFFQPRNLWRETYAGKSGIYSVRIESGHMELYEWK